MSNYFLAAGSARWRLGARSALDIRRPREAGGRACVDLVSNPANSNFPTLLNGSRGSAARAQMPTAASVPSPPHSIFRLKLAILDHLCPS